MDPRRDTLKLSIMLRDLAHLRVFAPQNLGIHPIMRVFTSPAGPSRGRWTTQFPCDVSFQLESLRLVDVTVQLVGLPSVRGTLEVLSSKTHTWRAQHISCSRTTTTGANCSNASRKAHSSEKQGKSSAATRVSLLHQLQSRR